MCTNIDWNKDDGFIPVIVQEFDTNEVLMLAYMNKEAFELTLKTKFAHYYSRSRMKIWKKGEESLSTQEVKNIFLDCDNDTLLLKVKQNGVACHTGNKSCFLNKIEFDGITKDISDKNTQTSYGILDTIYHTCLDRKLNPSENSYISNLYKKGENSYLKKIIEEAGELLLACKDLTKFEKYKKFDDNLSGEHKKNNPKYDVVYECADLVFHSIIALANHNIHPNTILEELKRREGTSGITEKNNREK